MAPQQNTRANVKRPIGEPPNAGKAAAPLPLIVTFAHPDLKAAPQQRAAPSVDTKAGIR
jgi:hypothetical protein